MHARLLSEAVAASSMTEDAAAGEVSAGASKSSLLIGVGVIFFLAIAFAALRITAPALAAKLAAAIASVGAAIGSAISTMGSAIKGAVTAVGSAIGGAIAAVGSAIGSSFAAVGSAIGGVYASIATSVSKMVRGETDSERLLKEGGMRSDGAEGTAGGEGDAAGDSGGGSADGALGAAPGAADALTVYGAEGSPSRRGAGSSSSRSHGSPIPISERPPWQGSYWSEKTGYCSPNIKVHTPDEAGVARERYLTERYPEFAAERGYIINSYKQRLIQEGGNFAV